MRETELYGSELKISILEDCDSEMVAEKRGMILKRLTEQLDVTAPHHLASVRRAVFGEEQVVLSQLHHFAVSIDGKLLAQLEEVTTSTLKGIVSVDLQEDDKYCSFQRRLDEALKYYGEKPLDALKKHSEKKNTSDVFVLYHPGGEAVAIFKPRDGEVGMPYAGKYPEKDVLKEEILRNVRVMTLEGSVRIKDAEKRLQALFPDHISRHDVVSECQEAIRHYNVQEATQRLSSDILGKIPRTIMEEIQQGTHLVRVSTKEGSLAGEGYLREVAAYLFCRAVGASFIPPTVVREIPNLLDLYGGRERLPMLVGSFQEFIPCYHSLRDEVQQWKSMHPEAALRSDYKTVPRLPGRTARCLAYLDMFMQNADRHSGNYDTRGNAVDHGLCFPDERGRHEVDVRLVLSIASKSTSIPEDEKRALLEYPTRFIYFLLSHVALLRYSCLQEFERNVQSLRASLQKSLGRPLDIKELFFDLYSSKASSPRSLALGETFEDGKETRTIIK